MLGTLAEVQNERQNEEKGFRSCSHLGHGEKETPGKKIQA